MRVVLQDVRYAIRLLGRQPLFTLIALATLALGIGANSAIFAVVNAVLLRPLPYRNADRLFTIEDVIPTLSHDGMPATPQDVLEFQRNAKTFSAIAGYIGTFADLTGQGQPERLNGIRVSPAIFEILGVQPVLGRGFTRDEDHPGSGVVVISYSLWQRRFGGESAVLGKTINLDREPVRIVGVLPKGFAFPLSGLVFGGPNDFWTPMAFTPRELSTIGIYNFAMVGKLKPGVTREQAQSDVQAVAKGITDKYPPQVRAEASLEAVATPVLEKVTQKSRRLLWLLSAAVGFVLLIGCVNVANLLLGRAAAREREMAVRSSLGASPGRLLRQLLTESVVLSVGGGTAGLLLALWLVNVLARVIPASVPRAATIDLDWRVAAFTAAISLVAGLIFGTMPSLMASRTGEAAQLKQSSRGTTAGAGRARLKGFLIVSEVMLSTVLLIGAGLLVRSLIALRTTPPGFDVEHVLTARVSLPARAYSSGTSVREFYDRAVGGLSAMPGVTSAGAAAANLLNPARGRLFVVRDPAVPAAVSSHAEVFGNYFEAVGIPLKRGRLFDSRDRAGTQPVLIVNETLAKRFFPGQDPIGQQMKLGSRESIAPWATIVGVVADAKNDGMTGDVRPQTYEAYAQLADLTVQVMVRSMVLAVKGTGDPSALAAELRGVVARIDPELPVTNLETTRATVEKAIGPENVQTALVGSFAVLALLLAAVGIYGVVSYAVTQRTQEIGVRMALGASRAAVVGMVVGQGMRFVLAGIAIGLAASYGLTGVMKGFLFEVKATDALTFGLAPLVLCAVALAANLAPARRAVRVDPVVALRYE